MIRKICASTIVAALTVTGFGASAAHGEQPTADVSIFTKTGEALAPGVAFGGFLVGPDGDRVEMNYLQENGDGPAVTRVEGLEDGQYTFTAPDGTTIDDLFPAPDFTAVGELANGVLELQSTTHNNVWVDVSNNPAGSYRSVNLYGVTYESDATRSISGSGVVGFTVPAGKYTIAAYPGYESHLLVPSFAGSMQRAAQAEVFDASVETLRTSVVVQGQPTGSLTVNLNHLATSNYQLTLTDPATHALEHFFTFPKGKDRASFEVPVGKWIVGFEKGSRAYDAEFKGSAPIVTVSGTKAAVVNASVDHWVLGPHGLAGKTGEARVTMKGFTSRLPRVVTLSKDNLKIHRDTYSGTYTTFTKLPAGTYTASVDGVVPTAKVVVRNGERTSVTLPSASEGRKLSGVVKNAAGQALSGAEVQLFSRTTGKLRSTTTTNDYGKYSFSGLPVGKYKVVVWPQAWMEYAYESNRIDGSPLSRTAANFDVKSSTKVVTKNLTTRKAVKISGIVRDAAGDPVPFVSVSARTADRFTDYQFTDENGRFVIERLPQGASVVLYAGDRDYESGYLTVSATVKASASVTPARLKVNPWW